MGESGSRSGGGLSGRECYYPSIRIGSPFVRRLALLACLLTLACSQGSGTAGSDDRLAINGLATGKSAMLVVTSPAFGPGGAIPRQYGDGGPPALSWSGLPPGTRSLALVVEDPDAGGADPFVHWLAWNIDPAAKGIEGSGGIAVAQGRNSRGGTGWFGPHPPAGAAHHYHFELFALDRKLDLAAGADRAALLGAMRGHVLGKGELVGMFAKT
jgi:Raf kinase inhibitor-like YbhB/YbcL family protein